MLRPLHARRSLALGAALVMTTWGAAAVPASADPGSGNSGRHAQSGSKDRGHSASKGQAKPGHKGKSGGAKGNAGKGNGGGNAGQGNGGGNAGGNASQGNGGGQSHGGSNAGGNGNGGGNAGQSNNGNGQGGGTSSGQGNSGGKSQGGGKVKGGSKGDPGGNNGTVKIAPLGELDGIPNNSPHPGCTFQVEWYGFDEGADIVSTVGFAMHSPTKDVGLSIAGDTSVFVGGDPASGAGTATGLDGTEVYTLSFDGEPHPKQGYHVKLTVHTPRSNGNDSKTKVFWVEPCETAPGDTGTDEPGTDEPGTDEPGTDEPGTDQPGTEQPGTDVPGSVEDETNPGDDIDVLGAEATDENDNGVSPAEAEANAEADAGADAEGGAVAGAQAAGGDDSNVPTAVDAGQSALDWVRSPLPLLIIALGAVLAAAAFVTRRRTRVPAGE